MRLSNWANTLRKFTQRYAKEKRQETVMQFLEDFFDEIGLCPAEIDDTLERMDIEK